MQKACPMIVQPLDKIIALDHRGMSNANGWPCDSAAGPVIIALFEFNCFDPPVDVNCRRLAL